MNKMTILKRTIIWLSAIAVFSFAILIFIGWEIRETIRHNGLTRIHTILNHKIEAIDNYVQHHYTSLSNVNELFYFASRHHSIFERDFWDHSPESLRNKLAIIAQKNDFYDVFLISLEGDIVYTLKHEDDLHTNLFTGRYHSSQLARVFKDALKNKSPYVSDFYFYAPSHDYAAFIAEPIFHNGKIIGITAVQIDNKAIQAVINDTHELEKTGKVITAVLENKKLVSMFVSHHTQVSQRTFSKLPHNYPIYEAVRGGSGQKYMIDQTGNNTVVAWGYQKDLRCGMMVKIDESELLQEWNKQTTSLLLLFFFGLIIIFSMLSAALRSFAKPIRELTHNALMISSGHYDIEINSSQYDHEWQLLIHAFQQMVIEIKHKMTQLNETNIALNTKKSELEEINATLEARIEAKTYKLQEYINIIDQHIIISQTNIHGIITYASEAFSQISGYSKEQLIGQNHRIIRHPDMPDEFFKNLWETISNGEIWHGEIKNRKADGSYYWVDSTISPNIEEGIIVGYTAVRHNITYQKRVEELAITDPMTGLYNRRHYLATIQEEMNRAKRHNSSMALMMLDVDYFKSYNDTYGHQAGDDVLIRIAQVLKLYTSRSGDYAFRLGGEEFALLVSEMSDEEYLFLGHRILNEVEGLAILHEKNDASAYVTISMGIFVYSLESGLTYEELYKEADDQLYAAKDQGRNQVILKNSVIAP
ncbi:MAG: diguanylate cyclase [Sulfuricurvum sp.]|nr:diguanylate cyclase [Sulfuricurvum sp.]MDD5386568.1 diguanylate cyclase [Sulfuricurvum sp.]